MEDLFIGICSQEEHPSERSKTIQREKLNCSEVATKVTAYPMGALEVGWPFKVVVAKRQHAIISRNHWMQVPTKRV